MLAVSQTVLIDSINQETRYDRKATIAVGNLLKQRDSLLAINKDQQRLIDSLRVESKGYRTEADTLRAAYSNLKFAFREKEIQVKSLTENFGLKEDLLNNKMKAIRRKRLGIGPSVGYGFANDGQSIFVGLSLNYSIIRF